MIRFSTTINRKVCVTGKSGYFVKNCEKISYGSFFEEKYQWFRQCTQISLKFHNPGFTCRSLKRFPLCYSSSKALSDDISVTLKFKTAFNPWLFLRQKKT